MPPPSLFFIFDLYRCRYTCRRLGGKIRDSLSALSNGKYYSCASFAIHLCETDSRGVGKDGGMPHTFLQKRWSMTLFAWRRSRVWNVFSSSSSSFSSSSFFLYGFLWFELCYRSCCILCPDEEEEDGPQEGGGEPAPLCTFMKSSNVTCLPHCFQRFVINA